MTKNKFSFVNISDCLEDKIEGLSESDLKEAISSFSSIDRHVEGFLKRNAEDFARQHKSVTYLVFSGDMTELVGYFTLAIKPVAMEPEKMSRTMERAFKKTGKFDEEMSTYTASAYLIAQLGKNFNPSIKNKIPGDALLHGALYILKSIQRDIGSTIVFLEAQDNENVLSFYQRNGFKALGRRISS